MASLEVCADHLGINVKVLQTLVRQSVIDRQDPGKYDVDAVRLQYLKHLRGKAGNIVSLGKSDVDAEPWELNLELVVGPSIQK